MFKLILPEEKYWMSNVKTFSKWFLEKFDEFKKMVHLKMCTEIFEIVYIFFCCRHLIGGSTEYRFPKFLHD